MTDRVEAAGLAYIESGGAPAERNAAESSVICSRRRRPLFANGSNDLSGCSSSGAGKSRKDWICFRSTDLNLAEGHACTRSGNGGAGSGDSLVRRAGCVRRRAFACGSSPVGLQERIHYAPCDPAGAGSDRKLHSDPAGECPPFPRRRTPAESGGSRGCLPCTIDRLDGLPVWMQMQSLSPGLDQNQRFLAVCRFRRSRIPWPMRQFPGSCSAWIRR